MHGYLLVEEIPPGWTAEQRLAVRGALGSLGAQSADRPAHINHIVVRPDGQAMVVEALFDESEIAEAHVISTIAAALNLPEASVAARIVYSVFEGGDWWERKTSALAYLAANSEEWDDG